MLLVGEFDRPHIDVSSAQFDPGRFGSPAVPVLTTAVVGRLLHELGYVRDPVGHFHHGSVEKLPSIGQVDVESRLRAYSPSEFCLGENPFLSANRLSPVEGELARSPSRYRHLVGWLAVRVRADD